MCVCVWRGDITIKDPLGSLNSCKIIMTKQNQNHRLRRVSSKTELVLVVVDVVCVCGWGGGGQS